MNAVLTSPRRRHSRGAPAKEGLCVQLLDNSLFPLKSAEMAANAWGDGHSPNGDAHAGLRRHDVQHGGKCFGVS
jgi:hypothetical protein